MSKVWSPLQLDVVGSSETGHVQHGLTELTREQHGQRGHSGIAVVDAAFSVALPRGVKSGGVELRAVLRYDEGVVGNASGLMVKLEFEALVQ